MSTISDKVRSRFEQYFVGSAEAYGELSVEVRREGILDVCHFLHDDSDLDFDHITDICSLDYPEDDQRFEMVYHFYSIRKKHRIRLKARVPEDDCVVASVTGIWQGASFMEREVFDLMGIRFDGHPDLRRILLTDDFDGHPLRKDFPTEGRGWRSTFEFMPLIMEE